MLPEGRTRPRGGRAGRAGLPGPPRQHWRRPRTNNVRERANGKIKRRPEVLQVFPSEASPARLVGAVLCERDEEWSGSRCFSERRTAGLYGDGPKPEPPTEERGEGTPTRGGAGNQGEPRACGWDEGGMGCGERSQVPQATRSLGRDEPGTRSRIHTNIHDTTGISDSTESGTRAL